MVQEPSVMPDAVKAYLYSRPRWIRWREWLVGRRYAFAAFPDRLKPLVVVAYSRRDSVKALEMVRAVEQDWPEAPQQCRAAYEEILEDAPKLVIIQFRRTNICGCLGHRHVVVKEQPFAEPHDALGGYRARCAICGGEPAERVPGRAAAPAISQHPPARD
jgi:hypothetical protein